MIAADCFCHSASPTGVASQQRERRWTVVRRRCLVILPRFDPYAEFDPPPGVQVRAEYCAKLAFKEV